MKFDKSWRGFGVDIGGEDHFTLYTPKVAVGFNSFRHVTKPWLSRGRRQEVELNIPLFKDWQFNFSTRGKDYLTLVDGPKYLKSLDWIIDEFDASFNDLAVASLRYHLDHSVCDNSDRRDVYEDLIARLTEPQPSFEGRAVNLDPVKGGYRWNPTDEERSNMAALRVRREAWQARQDKARHDFVDIMRWLWS